MRSSGSSSWPATRRSEELGRRRLSAGPGGGAPGERGARLRAERADQPDLGRSSTQRMSDFKPDLVHLIAHGAFDPELGQAVVALRRWRADVDRRERPAPGGDVEPARRSRRIVILQSCELGRADFSDASFAGMAPQLVRHGVARVIAMQYLVEVDVADQFVTKIYEVLGKAGDLDVAVQDARWEISNLGKEIDPFLLGVPVVYVQGSPSPRPHEATSSRGMSRSRDGSRCTGRDRLQAHVDARHRAVRDPRAGLEPSGCDAEPCAVEYLDIDSDPRKVAGRGGTGS